MFGQKCASASLSSCLRWLRRSSRVLRIVMTFSLVEIVGEQQDSSCSRSRCTVASRQSLAPTAAMKSDAPSQLDESEFARVFVREQARAMSESESERENATLHRMRHAKRVVMDACCVASQQVQHKQEPASHKHTHTHTNVHGTSVSQSVSQSSSTCLPFRRYHSTSTITNSTSTSMSMNTKY